MRLRDHHKGDLALSALTAAAAVAAVVDGAARWVARRRRARHRPGTDDVPRAGAPR